MIINRRQLYTAAPIEGMATEKLRIHGMSYGLTEAGYDIRVKQSLTFTPDTRFQIASSLERFTMPNHLVGVVHDKSTWARQGLSVFNTVVEPGWSGYLTLELVYHGTRAMMVHAGSPIAQVLFHSVSQPASYEGKYQDQPDRPVGAILEWEKQRYATGTSLSEMGIIPMCDMTGDDGEQP